MKFTSKHKNLKVHHPKEDRILARFKNGVFETEDKDAIEILKNVDEVDCDKSVKADEEKKDKKPAVKADKENADGAAE